eukprot:2337943-Karenia_brevis.AAC.1
MADKDLDDLYDKRTDKQKASHRNFIAYVGGNENDRVERKIRVNCKYVPWDSKIPFPPAMADFKKTTVVKHQGNDPEWHVLEDCVKTHEFEEVWDVDKMVVFL